MRVAGGAMDLAPSWQSHVVEDRELITGQNPFSDDALAKALVARLDKQASR
jgi:putative intracellular protease/amidase